MESFSINPDNIPLRGLKIIRKKYKNNRHNPQYREYLKQINLLIAEKERKFTVCKKVFNPANKIYGART